MTRSTTITSRAPHQLLERRTALAAALCLTALLGCGSHNPTENVGPPAGLVVVAGDDQIGTVGAAVALAPSVRVRDSNGRGVPGISVRFDVISGGGAVTGDLVVTDGEGLVRVGEWRLGPLPLVNTLRAQTVDHPFQVTIDATASVGAPSSIQIVSGGANLAAVVGEEVVPRPTVRVRDAFGNPIPNSPVTWEVVSGSGSIVGPTTTTTDSEGRTSVGGWKLGPASGLNQLRARTSNGIVATFNANGIGTPATIQAASPTLQDGFIRFAVPKTARVQVKDEFNANIAGIPVVFELTSGTGTVLGDTVITDANGVAALGDWKMGASGLSVVTATVPGYSGPPVVFTANGTVRAFIIDVRFLSSPPADLRDAYIAGAMRWMEVIVGDLPDFQLNEPNSWTCFTGFVIPPLTETVDDVIIYADLVPIDGPNNIIGQASDCGERPGNKLTVIGGMKFDIDDANNMLSTGRFTTVVIHEMGHVLGLIEDRYNVLGLATGLNGNDPFFTGNTALSAWPSLGISYSGNLIPLHNEDGQGSADHHWRESVLGDELMTPFVEATGVSMPLSAITVGAMADLGYLVDFNSADPFLPALRTGRPAGDGFLLNEVIYPSRWRLTENGRVVPIN